MIPPAERRSPDLHMSVICAWQPIARACARVIRGRGRTIWCHRSGRRRACVAAWGLLAGAAVRRGLPARRPRPGLLRPRRRPGRRCADRSQAAGRSLDPDLRLYAGRGSRRLRQGWDGFVKHLEKVTGKKVVFFPVQSNAAELEAMRSGRLHIAGFNTGSNPIAVNCAGFVPFAIMGSQKDEFGYEMEIIVQADSRSRRRPTSRARSSPSRRRRRTPASRRRPRSFKADFGLEAERDYNAGVFRQARQFGDGRRQQGLRRRGGRQRGDEAHGRPQGVSMRRSPHYYKSETFQPPATATRTISTPKLVEKIKARSSASLGGLGAQGQVQERGSVHPDHLQEGLERHPQDRRRQWREIHLQVTLSVIARRPPISGLPEIGTS